MNTDINSKCIIAACTNNVYVTRNTGKMKINYCYDHMGNIENYYCQTYQCTNKSLCHYSLCGDCIW